MSETILFLTGRLAEPRLRQVVQRLGLPRGSYEIDSLNIKVAALMTEAIVRNRLKTPVTADRVIVPGRSRMDLESLGRHYGTTFERGPDELVDLPQYFGKGGRPPDLTKHDLRIFAEIVEAPALCVDEFIARARQHRAAGADVIDIGCQPDVPFPRLEQLVAALKSEGLRVSVDSGDIEELRRGACAGADYVLSLDETTLDAVMRDACLRNDGTTCIPVLVPKPHGDMASLVRAIDKAEAMGLPHIADPILDPIHFGLMSSLERYAELRRRKPQTEILMGTGNLTELTDADCQGVTAVLLGLCSELGIRNVLVVQVSPHTRRTVEEHDAARRLMYRAREDSSLPKGYGGGLLSLHELVPFPQGDADIAAAAQAVRDLNFRIEAGPGGLHVYNRDGHHVAEDPFQLFDKLEVRSDGAHAFYLGYELAKAEIARALGKRYVQDRPLEWGVAAGRKSEDMIRHAPEGATLQAKTKAEAKARDEWRKAGDGEGKS